MIYLDNAATSWPKPPAVIRAMADFLERAGGNPGRSGHRLSIAAGRVVEETRDAVARLFNVASPVRVVFTHNATYALNLAVRGLLRPGDRAVVTNMDHNAVMRPLRARERGGVELAVSDFAGLERAARGARLVAVVHANNVTSELAPLGECARIAHAAGALLLVDAAQSAGAVPIDVPGLGVDLLAFTGHKGLLGPTGTGGLVIGEGVELEPLVRGGGGEPVGVGGTARVPAGPARERDGERGGAGGAGGDPAGEALRAARPGAAAGAGLVHGGGQAGVGGGTAAGRGVRGDVPGGSALRAVGAPDAGDVSGGDGAVLGGAVHEGGGGPRGGGGRGADRGVMSARGVVLFHTTAMALRAEKALAAAGIEVRSIPTPRELSSDCGIAVRFPWGEAGRVRELLAAARVESAGIRPLA